MEVTNWDHTLCNFGNMGCSLDPFSPTDLSLIKTEGRKRLATWDQIPVGVGHGNLMQVAPYSG